MHVIDMRDHVALDSSDTFWFETIIDCTLSDLVGFWPTVTPAARVSKSFEEFQRVPNSLEEVPRVSKNSKETQRVPKSVKDV